ncbi:MAG: hypothetical protein JSV42_00735, partial [Chloroflexota bacterium]
MTRFKFFVFIFAAFLILGKITSGGRAQSFDPGWSNPELLFAAPEGQKSNELWVLSDQANRLYLWWPLFEIDEAGNPASLESTLHSQRINEAWRSPNDILVWPEGGRLTSVVIDQSGMLHAFSATDCLSYTEARFDQAMSAHGWAGRTCLDETGLANPSVALGIDGQIFVVYTALGNHSLKIIHSENDGKTWSSFSTVQENPDDFFLDPIIAVDSIGRIHLVWSLGEAPDAYPPLGVFYSRSDDGGQNWTAPLQLGGMDEGQPAIAVFKDKVHVLWNGDASKGG